MIPGWAILSGAVAMTTAAMPLLQERLKVRGFTLAYWNKVFTALYMLPFVLFFGLPDEPNFYFITILSALIPAVSDVLYFDAVAKAGAGIVTRILPLSMLLMFVLWFVVDPALLEKYLAQPLPSLGIVAVMALAAFFAARLRRCDVSWQALRLLWFVILSGAIGPIINKLLLGTVPTAQGVFAFVFVQALAMMFFWSIYFFWRRPVARETFFSQGALKAGFWIGLFSGAGVALKSFAFLTVEHPAYVSVILLLDSVMVMAFNRLAGKKDDSDLVAGFGIVGCAVLLILLKSNF